MLNSKNKSSQSFQNDNDDGDDKDNEEGEEEDGWVTNDGEDPTYLRSRQEEQGVSVLRGFHPYQLF